MTASASGGGLPLAGRRIVVTRAADQASSLAARLSALGATVVLAPTIRTEPVAFALPVGSGWTVVTSPNGVSALAAFLQANPSRADVPGRLAVVGPGTAAAAGAAGLHVDLVPPRSLAESLVEAFPPAPSSAAVVTVLQADIARPAVVDGLRAKGWTVHPIVAYRTLPVAADSAVIDAVRSADAITFTSASTTRSFAAAYGPDSVPPLVLSIGPLTTAACHELAIRVSATATSHDLDGLVDAVLDALVA